MKLKVGVIGLGNAGGQIAALAKEAGMDAIAVNVSSDDNATIEDVVTTFGIGNAMGSGKNRDRAKEFGKQSIRQLIEEEQFDKFIKGCQIVFVVYSTGGGTGSGLGPMTTAVLMNHYSPKKRQDDSNYIRFVNIGILPAMTESLQAQNHTIDAIKELTSYDCCYLIYDNNFYSDEPVYKMMDMVNQAVVEDLKVIRGDYNILSKYGQIDQQDMLNIMSFPGMCRILTAKDFQEKDLEKTSIEDMLLSNMSQGPACEVERDRTVSCIAPIVNIRKSISQYFNPGLPKLKEVVGELNVGYEHFYVIEDGEEFSNRVHVILTGLSIPDDRLTKVVQRIEEAKNTVVQRKKSSVLSSVGQTENFVKAVNSATPDKETQTDEDVMNMF